MIHTSLAPVFQLAAHVAAALPLRRRWPRSAAEKPTSKRLSDARERGQVARSHELQDVVQLAAALMTLSWVGSYMVRTLADKVGAGLSRIGDVAHRDGDAVGADRDRRRRPAARWRSSSAR